MAALLVVADRPATAGTEDQTAQAGTNSAAAADNGLFNGLDHRSAYFRDFFPQPLLVEETSLEEGELEFGARHTQASQPHTDTVSAGVQKSFGLLTLELEVPCEHEVAADQSARGGVGNLSLDARYPLWQWVSGGGDYDTTLGVALEAGLPVDSVAGDRTEMDPMIFNDLKLGEHFSLQSVLGWSTQFGGGANGGGQTFEYGFDFAYALPHHALPLPGVQQFTPMVELAGETPLNPAATGQNHLLGGLGVRADLKPFGDVQPGLGLGWVFPVNQAARTEVHWGIAASLTLQF